MLSAQNRLERHSGVKLERGIHPYLLFLRVGMTVIQVHDAWNVKNEPTVDTGSRERFFRIKR